MKLFIVPSWYPSPAAPEGGSFFMDQARIFHGNGFDVTVIASQILSLTRIHRFPKLKNHKNSFSIENGLPTYRWEGINIHPGCQSAYFRRYRQKLTQLFKKALAEQGKPDMVLINASLWAGTSLAELLTHLEIPYLISEHHKEFITDPGFTDFQQKSIKAAYKYSSGIIATSLALRDGIVEKFPNAESKMHVIPNPVDTDFFTPGDSPVSENSFPIIAVSLLRPEKRMDLLIDAVSSLVGKGIAVTLTIVGNGPLRSRLRSQVSRLKLSESIKFTGYLTPEGVRDQLRKHKALILPSDVETFGVALIEAMACGLPVVAARCGGPESIIDESCGILVEKNDPEALANGIESLMKTIDTYNSETIRQRTIREFGSRTYVDQYRQLFEKITSANHYNSD